MFHCECNTFVTFGVFEVVHSKIHFPFLHKATLKCLSQKFINLRQQIEVFSNNNCDGKVDNVFVLKAKYLVRCYKRTIIGVQSGYGYRQFVVSCKLCEIIVNASCTLLVVLLNKCRDLKHPDLKNSLFNNPF